MRRMFLAAIVFSLVLFVTAALVGAWPNQSPTRATISGPGISGEVEITDPDLLENLKLGAVEDFASTVEVPEALGQGYLITRYFDDFRFGLLTYYPGRTSERGYLFFEDGPDKEGDRTAYDQRWLYATPQGEIFLGSLLEKLAGPGGSSSPGSAKPPSGNSAGSSNTPGTASPWILVVQAALAISAGLIVGFPLRRRSGVAR